MGNSQIIPIELIENKILIIRGQKVLLDRDLAAMYGVETKLLNKNVSRNISRFPKDFMFRLSNGEFQNLKFHFGTSSWGGTRKLITAGIYRTRCSNAFRRFTKSAGNSGKYPNYARVCNDEEVTFVA